MQRAADTLDGGEDFRGAHGLDGLLDIVLSVEEVGVYKPDPRVYQLAVDQLGIPASQISFQSSNAWDAFAASAFGMKVAWCNRYRQRKERLPGNPDHEIETAGTFRGRQEMVIPAGLAGNP